MASLLLYLLFSWYLCNCDHNFSQRFSGEQTGQEGQQGRLHLPFCISWVLQKCLIGILSISSSQALNFSLRRKQQSSFIFPRPSFLIKLLLYGGPDTQEKGYSSRGYPLPYHREIEQPRLPVKSKQSINRSAKVSLTDSPGCFERYAAMGNIQSEPCLGGTSLGHFASKLIYFC